MNGPSGTPDTTVYAKIRFPMAHAPAYANSQSFMNWGDCDLTGRVALARQRQGRRLSLPGQFKCRSFNDEVEELRLSVAR